jgi:hypothetical protein
MADPPPFQAPKSDDSDGNGRVLISREPGESVTIGDDIRVTVMERSGRKVRLAVEAPRSMPILRDPE